MQTPWNYHSEFVFRIRYICAQRPANVPHETVFTVGNHFRPPTNHAHFAPHQTNYQLNGRVYTQNQIFAWSPGQVTALDHNYWVERLEYHRSTSLFWCYDRAGYLIVPIDCTQRDVAPYPDHEANLYDSDDEGTAAENVSDLAGLESDNIPISWRRLTFGRDQVDPSFSKVGYFREHYRLGTHVPEPWNNHLIPPTQSRQNQADSSDENIQDEPRCRVAGDLGALIGLCAFGSKAVDTPETIRASFRPQDGNAAYARPKNPMPFHERAFERGVVVDIFAYRQQPGSRDLLRRWENGDFGPILT